MAMEEGPRVASSELVFSSDRKTVQLSRNNLLNQCTVDRAPLSVPRRDRVCPIGSRF